jgi:phage gp46-like protein
MADLKLVQGADDSWDIDWDDLAGDLVLTDDLETSVPVSIDTIARAQDGDDIPDNTDRRRGFWGDTFLETPEDTTGSRLWLVSRSKTVATILPRVRQLFEECLAWLVLDGVASAVRVQAVLYTSEVIAVRISIVRPDTGDRQFEFFYNWEAQKLARTFEEAA